MRVRLCEVSSFCWQLSLSPDMLLIFTRWLIPEDYSVSIEFQTFEQIRGGGEAKESAAFLPCKGLISLKAVDNVWAGKVTEERAKFHVFGNFWLPERFLPWHQSCWLSLWLQVRAALFFFKFLFMSKFISCVKGLKVRRSIMFFISYIVLSGWWPPLGVYAFSFTITLHQ